jgi:hypothetical protein
LSRRCNFGLNKAQSKKQGAPTAPTETQAPSPREPMNTFPLSGLPGGQGGS